MAILKIKDKGVWKEIQAIKGDTGNGIQNIEKVSTVGNVDTYAINYTDGTQTTFDVTNSEVTKEQLDEVDNKAKNTRNELERVKNDVLETGTATDTFVHLEDSAMAEYQELSVDGVCEQETTTGKNLASLQTSATKIIGGVDFTINNGIININGTTTNDDQNYFFNSFRTNSESAVFSIEVTGYTDRTSSNSSIILQQSDDNSSWSILKELGLKSTSTHQVSVTLDSSKYYRIRWYAKDNTFTNATIKVQLEYGNSKTDFEPYTNGPSPSPDYPQEIEVATGSVSVKSTGKNLFNEENVVNLALSDKIIYHSSYKGYYTSCKEGDVFSLSRNDTTNNRFRVVFATEEPANGVAYFGGTGQTTAYDNSLKIENIVAPKNANYIFVYLSNIGDELPSEIQLEKGSVATEYEPYKESSITANLPEGEFIGKISDTYKDTLKVEYNEDDGQHHLKLYKKSRHLRLAIADMNNNDNYPGWKNVPYLNNDYPGKNMPEFPSNIKSNIGGNSSYFGLNTGATNSTLLLNRGSWGLTQTEWKEQYPDLVVDIYYELATPYTVDLGIVDMPITYNEITNLFTDSNLPLTINAKYYRNFISTVRNLQVNEKALKQELIDINTRLSALESAQTSVISESEVVK